MTAERIAQIRARADAATRGPWHVQLTAETYIDRPSRYPIYSEVRGVVDVAEGDTYVAQTKRGNEQARADAEFIAHAREDVAVLLAEIERLRAALVEATAELIALRDGLVVTDSDRADARAELRAEGLLPSE